MLGIDRAFWRHVYSSIPKFKHKRAFSSCY